MHQRRRRRGAGHSGPRPPLRDAQVALPRRVSVRWPTWRLRDGSGSPSGWRRPAPDPTPCRPTSTCSGTSARTTSRSRSRSLAPSLHRRKCSRLGIRPGGLTQCRATMAHVQGPEHRMTVAAGVPDRVRRIIVSGTEGSALLDRAEAPAISLRTDHGVEEVAIPPTMPLAEELRVFLAHLDGGPPPVSDAATALAIAQRLSELQRRADEHSGVSRTRATLRWCRYSSSRSRNTSSSRDVSTVSPAPPRVCDARRSSSSTACRSSPSTVPRAGERRDPAARAGEPRVARRTAVRTKSRPGPLSRGRAGRRRGRRALARTARRGARRRSHGRRGREPRSPFPTAHPSATASSWIGAASANSSNRRSGQTPDGRSTRASPPAVSCGPTRGTASADRIPDCSRTSTSTSTSGSGSPRPTGRSSWLATPVVRHVRNASTTTRTAELPGRAQPPDGCSRPSSGSWRTGRNASAVPKRSRRGSHTSPQSHNNGAAPHHRSERARSPIPLAVLVRDARSDARRVRVGPARLWRHPARPPHFGVRTAVRRRWRERSRVWRRRSR